MTGMQATNGTSQIIYRILIVDDELPIREELHLFPFESLRCVIAGQAENGRKALEFMQAHPVDIVITDIRMPVMNGLQLIEEAKKLYPGVQFILLSCINDFEPIQQALKMGVVDYILKGTYTEDELATAVLKAVSRIVESESNRLDHAKEKHWSALRLLSRLVHGEEVLSKDNMGMLKSLGVIGEYPQRAIWINFLEAPAETGALIDELRAEYLSDPGFMESPKLHFMQPGGCLVIYDLNSINATEPASITSTSRSLVSALYSKTGFSKSSPLLSTACFIPGPMHSDKDLVNFFRGIGSSKDWGFYLEAGMNCEAPIICRPLSAIDTSGLHEDFISLPVESFMSFLKVEFRNFLTEARIRKAELMGFVSAMISEYLRCSMKSVDPKEILADIQTSTSLDGLVQHIEARFSRLVAEKKYNKCIIHAMQFINNDLSKPLSLSAVAENTGISSSYLSSLFFRETGKQFNEYVTEKRMEMAMDLLRNTNHKVYEVAELVGIASYRYFSRLFKDHTGVAPRDFK